MIEVQKLDKEIGFRVSGELIPQIYQWERAIDEMVFNEQLATGSFRGKYPIAGIRSMMEKAKRAGKVLPYYGAGGSSGACIYKFQINGSECRLQVEHSLAKEVLDLAATIEKPNTLLSWEREPEIQFSPLPYFTSEELSHPWTGERNKHLICKIAAQEYENLEKWPHWVDSQALTPRYCYQFGQVSIGPTGFAVKVLDRETEDIIDVTDYDSW